MNELWLDIRFALRGLRKRPMFATLVIATLAIGIGFSASIFTLVDTALYKPIGYRNEGRVVSVGSVWSGGFDHSSVSIPEYLDYRERARSFDAIAAYRRTSVNMTAGSGEPENLQAALVTAEFLDVLGVPVSKGRAFEVSDDIPGAEQVVILGDGLWRRRFGSRDVIGSSISVDGDSYRVIGIMPPSMGFPAETDLWTTLRVNEADPGNRGAHNRQVIARLGPGVTIERARREVSSIADALKKEYPEDYPEGSGWGVSLLTLRDVLVGEVRTPLLILMAAVSVLMLIAGANVANLMLARLWRRRDEMATRAALGARQSRLVRQVITESLVLGLLGGAGGAGLAWLLTPLLVRLAPESVRSVGKIGVDFRTILFTLAASVLVSIFFGLIAAGTVSHAAVTRMSFSGVRTTRGSGVRKLLIVAEVGLAFLLLVGAGLLIRTFTNLVSTDPGLVHHDVVTARISLSRDRYTDDAARTRFFDQLLEHLRARPGVESAGAVSILPLGGSDTDYGFGVEGWTPPAPDFTPFEQARVVTPGYFETLGVPVRQGRAFELADREDSPPVVVVSASFARKYWGSEDPIGKRIRLWGLDAEGQPWRSVVGVVGDIRHFGLAAEAPPIIYFPLSQLGQRSMSVVARSSIASPTIIGEETRAIDPEQAVYGVETMDAVVADSLATPRLNLMLLGMFATVAILLAAIGIYGVLSFLVNQRTREIGIRLALGASPGLIRRSVVTEGMSLVLGGVVLGAIGSAAVTNVARSMLHGVSPADPVTYVAITLIVLVIAAVACWQPAVRATRIDPSDALRQ